LRNRIDGVLLEPVPNRTGKGNSLLTRSLLKERQREGIAIAKKAGVYKGRKPSLTPERVAELRKRISTGEKKAALAREFGISRETLYQYAPVIP
jgi:DNA invertase Pin-like site-specific DNA recombinase